MRYLPRKSTKYLIIVDLRKGKEKYKSCRVIKQLFKEHCILIMIKQSGFYVYEKDFQNVYYTIYFWLEQIMTQLTVLALSRVCVSVIMCDCQDRGMNDNCVSQSPDIIITCTISSLAAFTGLELLFLCLRNVLIGKLPAQNYQKLHLHQTFWYILLCSYTNVRCAKRDHMLI